MAKSDPQDPSIFAELSIDATKIPAYLEEASKKTGEKLTVTHLVVKALALTLKGAPELRGDFVTDNGNLILDVHDLQIHDPEAMEAAINNVVGVVCCGVFAAQAASEVIVAYADGRVALL